MEAGTFVFNMFSAMVHNLWDIVAVPVQMLLAIAATSSGVDSTDEGSVHQAVMERVFERHLATAGAPRYATCNSEVDGIGGLRVQTYQDRFCEVCEMSFQMARTFWCATIRRLATVQAWHPGRLSIEAVAFHVMGDETPATFRLRETVAAPIASREVQVRTDYAIAPVQRENTANRQVVKVVQCELRLSILVRAIDESGHSRFTHYSGELPVPLASFDHNTGENLRQWYKDVIDIPGFRSDELANCVKRVYGMTTMDLAAANTRMLNFASNSETGAGGNGWRRGRFPCMVHRLQTCMGHCYDLVSYHISALVALALGVAGGGTFAKLKRSLGWIMSTHLVWYGPDVPKPAPTDAQRVRRDALFDACIPVPEPGAPGRAVARKRRVILKRLINGDTTLVGKFEHYCDGPPHCCVNEADTKRQLKSDCVWALMPSPPKPFPVHRWTGADLVCASVALIANLCGLLALATPIWLALARKDTIEFTTDDEVRRFVNEERRTVDASDIEDSDGEGGLAAPRAWAGRKHGKQQTASDSTQVDWTERSRKHRTEVKTWARSSPGTPVLIMLLCIRPGTALMSVMLRRAGKGWDTEEADKCLKTGNRNIRVLQEHDGDVWKAFGEQILGLLSCEDLWASVPEECRTMEARSLAFRLLSRSLVTVWLLLVLVCRGYPHKLFSILGLDPVAAATHIVADSTCLYCGLTQGHLEEFPDVAALVGELSVQLVLLLGWQARSDISRIEARNAHISHQARLRGGHCATTEFPYVSGFWTLTMIRSMFHNNALSSSKVQPKSDLPKKKGMTPKVKEAKAGKKWTWNTDKKRMGPYRAFLKELAAAGELKGQFGSQQFRTVAARYGALSPEGRRRFKLLGDITADDANPAAGDPAADAAHDAADGQADPADGVAMLAGGVVVPAAVANEWALATYVVDNEVGGIVKAVRAECSTHAELIRTKERNVSENASSKIALARLSDHQRCQQAFFANALPTRFATNTNIMEVIPPITDMARVGIEKLGQPRHDPSLLERFGCQSVHAAFREAWRKRHDTYRHASQPKLGKVSGTAGTKSICRLYGMCVCAKPALRAFLQKFVVLVKLLFLKGSEWADCCDAGGCIVEFRMVDGVEFRRGCFAQLSYVNRQSWATGLLQAFRSENRQRINVAKVFGHLALRVAPNRLPDGTTDVFAILGCANAPLFFQHFDLDLIVNVRMYEVVGGSRQAPVWTPGEVEVKWIGDEMSLWEGAAKELAVPVLGPRVAATAGVPVLPHAAGLAPPVGPDVVVGDPSVAEVVSAWAVGLEAVLDQYATEQDTLESQYYLEFIV